MDKRIREAMEREANAVQVSEVPWEQIRNRAEVTTQAAFVQNGRQNRGDGTAALVPLWRKKRVGYAAASVLVAGAVFSSGFVSPAMAEVLSKVPLVGSIFQVEGVSDSGLRSASLGGLEMPLNLTVSDKGVKLTFINVIADENRTSVSFKAEFPEGMDGSVAPMNVTYEMPDRGLIRLQSGGAANAFSWKQAEERTYIGTFNVFNNEQKEDFSLKLSIGQLGGVSGDWKAEIPVSLKKAAELTKVLTPNVQAVYKDTPITLEQIRVAPTATTINFHMRGKAVENMIINDAYKIPHHSFPFAEITDDKGRKLQKVKADDGSSWPGMLHNIARDEIRFSNVVNPLTDQPKYLDIKLYFDSHDPSAEMGNVIFEQRVELDWKSTK